MCFCYNQTQRGRKEDFTQEWFKEHGSVPNERQRKVLDSFALNYQAFIEFVYPGTDMKLDILKQVVDILGASAHTMSIRTLDGEVINWAFYATEGKNRKYYDVIDHRHKSYKSYTFKERITTTRLHDTLLNNNFSDFPEKLQLDSVGMKRRFLSYLIHSIDASILRRIINKMKKEHQSSINDLHDCVVLHSNDLDSLYTVIKDIYSSPDIYNLVDYGVFDQIDSVLSNEGKQKLQDLRSAFFKLTDNFVSEVVNINPHHMYSLQD